MIADEADDQPLATLSITGRLPIDMVGPVTIGRDPRSGHGAVVVVDDDPLVSKSHLALDVDADGFVITDLGSSNGTFLHHVGGETTVPTDSWIPVPPGSEIEFGDQRMTIDVPAVSSPSATDSEATPRHGIVAPVPTIAPPDPWGAAGVAEPSIACTHCHRGLPVGSKFCDGCGTPTTPESAPTPPSATRPASCPAAPSPVPPPVAAPHASHAQPVALQPGATVVVPAGAIPQSIGPRSAPSASPRAPAPFDPNQPGAPVFVDLSSPTSSSGGPLKIILGVVGAVVVLVVIGVVLSRVLGGDDGTGGDPASIVAPDTVDELWSESVRGESSGAFADDAGVYVATFDFDSSRVDVVAFDRGNGDELWEAELDGDGGFADVRGSTQGVLIVTVCDAECSVFGLDLITGGELWTAQISDGFPRVTDRHVLAVDDESLEVLDPLTGDRIDRVRGDDVLIADDHVLVTDGDDIEVFDLELNSLLGPEPVDRADATAFDGSRLIVADADELRFIDADGTVVKTSSVDVGLIDEVRPVADDNIVLNSDEGVISINPLDDTADERWSERGELSRVVEVDGGTVVIVDGDESFRVIDADSGEQRFERDLDLPDSGFTFPARNLLVVFEFDGFGDPVELSAYDWETGAEMWSERFDDFPIVSDGLVVEMTRDGDVIVFG